MRAAIAAVILAAALSPAFGAQEEGTFKTAAVTTFLTDGDSVGHGRRTPFTGYGLKDDVVYFVRFDWKESGQPRAHAVVWNWYAGDKVVSTTSRQVRFTSKPFELWSRRHAAALGAGSCSVETSIDGRVVARNDFEVSATAEKPQ